MPLKIAISLGDITGIGPEVTLKALSAEADYDTVSYSLIGDAEHAYSLNRRLELNLPFQTKQNERRGIVLINPLLDPLPSNLKPGAAEAARAAVAWVSEGAQSCLRQEFDALVTAPVNKESIIRAGLAFVGQTE